jgi:hypothetical protein
MFVFLLLIYAPICFFLAYFIISFRERRKTRSQQYTSDAYRVAGDELLNGKVDPALWAEAMVAGGGNDGKVKARYIELRLAALHQAKAETHVASGADQAPPLQQLIAGSERIEMANWFKAGAVLLSCFAVITIVLIEAGNRYINPTASVAEVQDSLVLDEQVPSAPKSSETGEVPTEAKATDAGGGGSRFTVTPSGKLILVTNPNISDEEAWASVGEEPVYPLGPGPEGEGYKGDFIDTVQAGFGGLVETVGTLVKPVATDVGVTLEDAGYDIQLRNPTVRADCSASLHSPCAERPE